MRKKFDNIRKTKVIRFKDAISPYKSYKEKVMILDRRIEHVHSSFDYFSLPLIKQVTQLQNVIRDNEKILRKKKELMRA